jgi:hypothetical protein
MARNSILQIRSLMQGSLEENEGGSKAAFLNGGSRRDSVTLLLPAFLFLWLFLGAACIPWLGVPFHIKASSGQCISGHVTLPLPHSPTFEDTPITSIISLL